MSLCMGCMTDKGESVICPKCGLNEQELKNASQNFLQPGSRLNDRYTVGIALGQGGFGITYIGYDNVLGTRVAIKEYYPNDSAQRESESRTVRAFSGGETDFEKGKEKFLTEARTLARFSEYPGVVSVKDCFGANGTAYMVMQYLDGTDLKQYLNRRGGKLGESESIQILMPVTEALKEIHKTGIIHRDISPDNIFMTNDGQVKLIDFGAARQSFGDNKSISVTLKPGYAPEEQYRTRGNQGPWTDVYALSATLYRMVTGNTPPESIERVMDDELVIPDYLSANVRYALKKGMAVKAADRFEYIEQLMNAILGKAQPSQTQKSAAAPQKSYKNPIPMNETVYPVEQKRKRNGIILVSVLSALAVICAVVTTVLVIDKTNDKNVRTTATQTTPSQTTPKPSNTESKKAEETVVLEDLYNSAYTYKRMDGISGSTLVTSKSEYDDIVNTIRGYCNSYSAFVETSDGSEQDFIRYMSMYLKTGSKAYTNQFKYYQKYNISYNNLNSMDVKCVRKSGNMYYAWDSEVQKEIKSGVTVTNRSDWVYLIEKNESKYLITDYIPNPVK